MDLDRVKLCEKKLLATLMAEVLLETKSSKIIILSWFIVFIRLNLRSSMMAGSEIRVADYQKLRPITIII